MKIKGNLKRQGIKNIFISHSQQEHGITLMILVITIIILIILSLVTIKIANDGGLIDVTDKSVSVYIDKDKQERLEHALEAAKIEKERNKRFNKNIDLDKIIKNDIPEAEINGDKITITGSDFFVDRNKLNIIYEEPKGELAEGDIPIYSAEQLQRIGTGETVYIDGKKYLFEKNRKYVLKNDIEYVGSYTNIAEIIQNKEITFDGQSHKIIVTDAYGRKVYYTEENKYCMGTNKYGYVVNGLQLYYDGIDNIGTGTHNNSSTVWRDLSGNNRDGILVGGVWEDKYLTLNGSSSNGISIGDQAKDLFKSDNTIEMVVNFDADDGAAILIGNYNVSRCINYEKSSANKARIYFDGSRPDLYSSTADLIPEVYHSLSYTFNKNAGIINLYRNTNNIHSFTHANYTTYDANWTAVYIGRDSKSTTTSLKGKISTVRIYDRALSEEEIEINYQTDQTRFGI